jgi:hypothetical protein
MPWYYYSGTVVRPVPRGDGVTVAARPHTKVEIVKPTPETQAMIRKNLLKRTGPPKEVKERKPVDTKKIREVVPKSTMARFFAEKGETDSAKMKPRVRVGKPEMTEPEEAGIRPENAKKDAGVADVSSDADEAGSASDKKSKGRKKKK